MLRKNNKRMPDVLDCLANLSNDEIFTPPEIANRMLDLLPQELFESKETTFLDPFTKSGVFLREITKRLLSHQIPNYEEMSGEIDEIEKTAIQKAVKSGDLDLQDANSIHKPIVIERLKFKGKEKLKDYNSNNSKNFNRNMFAYNKMINALMASAIKYGIEIYQVGAMYTSLIGKIKYQPYYKRSIHQMAALAIARRAMHPKRTERIPKRTNCSSWQEIYKANK